MVISHFLHGITITLINDVDTGKKDGFGKPITNEVETTVDNVLVSPSNSLDEINNTSMDADLSTYTLAIPKGDTNTWKNAKVRYKGKLWRVVGEPLEGIEDLVPLDWHKKVTIKSYE